jgi:aryl-alcohol dehydrogenase-like predicted oxidoreductase
MNYRRLGRTELQVSELGYGAARGYDDGSMQATVVAALEAGVNFFDTAGGYGDSELALGDVLQGRADVIIETKYCPYETYAVGATYVGTPGALVASAEESLRRLRRDYLDIFLGHGLRTLESLDRFMNEGCYEAMVKLREQGKVRFIGISELSEGDGTHEILQRAVPTGTFDVVLLTLNFLLQTAAESVLPLCAKHDVGVATMMPLNQPSPVCGLIGLEPALEAVRRYVEHGDLSAEPPYTEDKIFDFLQPYSIPEAAIRYVLSHPVGTCCVGMRSTKRLQENLQAATAPYLDEARLARLRELFGGVRWQVR